MSLGIIPELEADCTPRPGELVVSRVSQLARTLTADWADGSGLKSFGPWEDFSLRYCGPWAPRDPEMFAPGDIVVIVERQ